VSGWREATDGSRLAFTSAICHGFTIYVITAEITSHESRVHFPRSRQTEIKLSDLFASRYSPLYASIVPRAQRMRHYSLLRLSPCATLSARLICREQLTPCPPVRCPRQRPSDVVAWRALCRRMLLKCLRVTFFRPERSVRSSESRPARLHLTPTQAQPARPALFENSSRAPFAPRSPPVAVSRRHALPQSGIARRLRYAK